MKKMFFLTAIFQNKFGKANKYYDEKGWHWMLASDKPKLYDSIEMAKIEADELAKDILSEIYFKEIEVYTMLWEHKVDSSIHFKPTNVLYEIEEKDAFIFLSLEKQMPQAKLIDGLYRIDRKNDIWIYGSTEVIVSKPDKSPDELIGECYQKLQEASALMKIFDFDKSQITKIEGVMTFVHRLLKNSNLLNQSDSDITTTPEDLISISYKKLEEAKNAMIFSSYEKSEISKLEGVMLFVKKLM